ncbi:hypothetical protein GGU11DRAFT_810052 [Lentinula aff. detonsa]|nr:hypothetical protein GGU11DRAFT_810052 [Lentinula aff. detonsa]
MFPDSSSSTLHNASNPQPMFHAKHNELISSRYNKTQEFYSSEIPQISCSSSPMSSPPTYPRPRLSRRAYDQPFSFSHSHRYSTYPSPETGCSSPYPQRLSSPSTSSSSPPPLTSPFVAFTRFDDDDRYQAYSSREKFFARNTNELLYMVNDAQYDGYPRNLLTNDEIDPRPKLPSFRSLFGEGEAHHDSPSRTQREDDLYLDPFSSPMSSPSFKAILPPFKSLPAMRPETSKLRANTSSSGSPTATKTFAITSIPSLCQPSKRYTGFGHRDTDNHRAQVERSSHSNVGEMLSEIDSDIPLRTVPSHSVPRTPPRRKNLFSDADSPSIIKDTEITFFSPSKISPYPRRTYFLESSERERCSPGPVDAHGLHQLAEIAGMAQPDILAAKQDTLVQSPDQTEGLSIDSATSPSSSPFAYPPSLPPSSPLTSEAQLSPVVHGKNLPATTVIPLTDVINLTVESPRVDDSCPKVQEYEARKAHKLGSQSRLEENGLETGPTITSTNFPVPMQVSTQEFTEVTAIVADHDEMHHSVSSFRNIDPESKSIAATVGRTGSGEQYRLLLPFMRSSMSLNSRSSATSIKPLMTGSLERENSLPGLVQGQGIDQCNSRLLSSKEDESRSADVLTVSTTIAPNVVPVPATSAAPRSSTSALEVSVKQIAVKSNNQFKTKSSSTAPSIASSAPRVTVTVVKRLRPASTTQHVGEKEAFTLIKGKQKEIFKTKTSEVLDSHSPASKRQRLSPTLRNHNVLEGSFKKKSKNTTEENQTVIGPKTLPSTVAEVITTSFKQSEKSKTKSTSIVPAKRKASYEIPSHEILHNSARSASPSTVPAKRKASYEISSPQILNNSARSALTSPNHPSASSAPLASSSNPQKRLKAVAIEVSVPSKSKQPSPADNNTWVDKNWVHAVAVAYGSPHGLPRIPRNNVVAQSTAEVDSKSPRSMNKRMIIESDSEEDDSEVEDMVTLRQSSRKRFDSGPQDSESEENVEMRKSFTSQKSSAPDNLWPSDSELTEPDEDEDDEMVTVRQSSRTRIDSESQDSESEENENVEMRQPSTTQKPSAPDDLISLDSELTELYENEESEEEEEGEEEEEEDNVSIKKQSLSSNPISKTQKPKLSPPLPSPLDLELIGIVVEAMSLSRSSSHLALSLYRTVCDTRNGVLANLMNANFTHFDAVTEKIRSQELFGCSPGNTEQPSRRGRPKRGATVNEEGGTAGMSEADIMWVSEFERVMKESAARCGMFGLVESSFRKDPRDRPLPFSSRFFYVPDCDPDTERALLIRLTMPGSGKRSETKKYKQYYWKPVGK